MTKRYGDIINTIDESPYGRFVKYTDYEKLQKFCEDIISINISKENQLKKENEELKKENERLIERLEISPQGDDRIDALRYANDFSKHDIAVLKNKNEELLKQQKKYQEYKEKERKRKAKWYQKNKDRVNEHNRKWYQENKEKVKEKRKEYYLKKCAKAKGD